MTGMIRLTTLALASYSYIYIFNYWNLLMNNRCEIVPQESLGSPKVYSVTIKAYRQITRVFSWLNINWSSAKCYLISRKTKLFRSYSHQKSFPGSASDSPRIFKFAYDIWRNMSPDIKIIKVNSESVIHRIRTYPRDIIPYTGKYIDRARRRCTIITSMMLR